MKQMGGLKFLSNLASKSMDAIGYVDGFIDISNGNTGKGTHKVLNNTVSIVYSSVYGCGIGLLYNVSYSGWEYLLDRSETYNRWMYGKGSIEYNKRDYKYNWRKSKILE